MMTVVAFKWQRIRTGMQLPSTVNEYGPEHVNILYRSIARNTTVPFRFVCVTDNPVGLCDDIEIVDLWDRCRDIGGCYNRLYMFSSDMREILGTDRFIAIDLDAVIVSNIDHILTMPDDFVINEYDIANNNHATHQYYNGGIIMMDVGSRERVWKDFDPVVSPSIIQPRKDAIELVGSDQAWISYTLGPGERALTPADGVYDYRKLPNKKVLPENAAIVMFAGRRDPLTEFRHNKWIQTHWKGSSLDMESVYKKTRRPQRRFKKQRRMKRPTR